MKETPMRNELTVVIPVYNVEKYLSKCTPARSISGVWSVSVWK